MQKDGFRIENICFMNIFNKKIFKMFQENDVLNQIFLIIILNFYFCRHQVLSFEINKNNKPVQTGIKNSKSLEVCFFMDKKDNLLTKGYVLFVDLTHTNRKKKKISA